MNSIRFDFEKLIEHLKGKFNFLNLKVNKNIEMLIYSYKIWAEFETYKIRNKSQMEKIMNQLIKLESTVDIWFDYISYEKYFGDLNSIRKIYKKAIEYCKKDKKLISEKWLNWENMYDFFYK